MKNRIKKVYLSLGHILNNPKAFGLDERAPKELAGALSAMQRELFEELKDEMTDEELLAAELSQDADQSFVGVTSTSFVLQED
jgi:hypothetical protein